MDQGPGSIAGESEKVLMVKSNEELAAKGLEPTRVDEKTSYNRIRNPANPRYLFWLTLGGIFLAEVIAMFVVSLIAPLSNAWGILLDALIMTALVFPIVYFLSFRPLLIEVTRSHQAEAILQEAREELELRVEERSKELQAALELSRQRRREVEALLEGSRTILEQREFPVAARAIFDSCKSLIGATAGYVALGEGDSNAPLFLDPGDHNCVVDPNLAMPIRGLRAQAYQSQRTVYENSFLGSEWIQFLPEGHAELSNVLFLRS